MPSSEEAKGRALTDWVIEIRYLFTLVVVTVHSTTGRRLKLVLCFVPQAPRHDGGGVPESCRPCYYVTQTDGPPIGRPPIGRPTTGGLRASALKNAHDERVYPARAYPAARLANKWLRARNKRASGDVGRQLFALMRPLTQTPTKWSSPICSCVICETNSNNMILFFSLAAPLFRPTERVPPVACSTFWLQPRTGTPHRFNLLQHKKQH